MNRISKTVLSAISALPLLLLANGCGIIQKDTAGPSSSEQRAAETGADRSGEQAAAKTTTVDVEKLDAATVRTGIELILEIPREPVDKYVVNYGFERDKLENKLEIKASDLEKLEYDDQGYVYRYVIDSLPGDRTIYMSLVSVSGEKASEPSQVFEVQPEDKL